MRIEANNQTEPPKKTTPWKKRIIIALVFLFLLGIVGGAILIWMVLKAIEAV